MGYDEKINFSQFTTTDTLTTAIPVMSAESVNSAN